MNKCIIIKEKMKNVGREISNWLSNNPNVKIIAISQMLVPSGMIGNVCSTIIYEE